MTARARLGLLLAMCVLPARALLHDLERTSVTIDVAADGTFVCEVANDPTWLLLRLEPFAGRTVPPHLTPLDRDRRLAELARLFTDRVVLFVDGHEVRPDSAEYVPPDPISQRDRTPRGVFRLRGQFPQDARTLRWFYGLVIDPYPLTVTFANGSPVTRTVMGEAWSEPIALPPRARRLSPIELLILIGGAALLLTARWWLAWAIRRRRPTALPRESPLQAASAARCGHSA
jgi:hypothetical protein